jgi:protein-S-isoprenylcysteine O-methyltransferase Ste14
MPSGASSQPQEESADAWVRAGAWLFRHRTALPLPLAVALLLIPTNPANSSRLFDAAGASVVAAGELIRLWAVRHIGVISRTRSERLGPLITTGPFAFVRNPLYLGNIALWAGFGIAAHLPWAAAAIGLSLAVEYHAIVRWEERLLEARRGTEYREYLAHVPRWMPTTLTTRSASPHERAPTFTWRETFFSERGTLIAIAVGYVVLWMKVKLKT